MYIKTMAAAVSVSRMKPVTVYFNELMYLKFQQMAARQNRKAAELVRDAMDEYLENHNKPAQSLDDWKPLSLGGLVPGAADWISKDYQDELLGSAF